MRLSADSAGVRLLPAGAARAGATVGTCLYRADMTSHALAEWFGTRAARLDRLVDAHRAVAGPGPGRRWLTEEVNHALIVRLAGEFQGYCRDLHDEAVEVVTASAASSPPAIVEILRAGLIDGRQLDRGNATWSNVCNDFARLGLSLADEVKSRHPARYSSWVDKVGCLNAARNAIAHHDRAGLAACQAQQPLTLGTFTTWRSALRGVSAAMETAVGAYLRSMTGAAPW